MASLFAMFSLLFLLFLASNPANSQRIFTTTTTNTNSNLNPSLFLDNPIITRGPDIERTVLTVIDNPKPLTVSRGEDRTTTILTVSDRPKKIEPTFDDTFDDIPVIPAPKPTPPPRRSRPTTAAPPVYRKFDEEEGVGRPYSFSYETDGSDGSAVLKRSESSDGNGRIVGSYSYYDPDGIYRIVDYTADENGFNAKIRTNEPGVGRVEDLLTGRDSGSNYFRDPANTEWEVEPPPQNVLDRWDPDRSTRRVNVGVTARNNPTTRPRTRPRIDSTGRTRRSQ